MDAYVFISVFSVMYSWISCTVLSAPATETPAASTVTAGRHVRNKRCSCATFLDKECVYFCHLDIIWVNTPERVVSYGLGDAPRTKRALLDSMATTSGPRCQCSGTRDHTCRSFCRLDNNISSETRADTGIRSAEDHGCTEAHCKRKLATRTGGIQRMRTSNKKQVSPLAIRAALKTHLLLKKWMRRHQGARAKEGESATP